MRVAPDLSPYDGRLYCYLRSVYMVGWLAPDVPYCRGPVPAEFVDKLWRIVSLRTRTFDLHVNLVRCVKPCFFCGAEVFYTGEGGRHGVLGVSEIWVPGLGGHWFAAPSLIVHFVEEHGYKPPAIFVEAVMGVNLASTILAQAEFDHLARELRIARGLPVSDSE